MMGYKGYLSEGCDLPGKLLFEKLDKNKKDLKKDKQRSDPWDFLL